MTLPRKYILECIQTKTPIEFGGAQDGFRGVWEQGMNFYCLTLKDREFIRHFQQAFNAEDPYQMSQSIKTIFPLGVGNYGDSSEETEKLCKEFFEFAQRYSGDNAESFYLSDLDLSVYIRLLITLDKSAAWKALGSGGALEGVKHWCYASAHIRAATGRDQPYICLTCKPLEDEYCRRPSCSCRMDKRPCDSPCKHVWVSKAIFPI